MLKSKLIPVSQVGDAGGQVRTHSLLANRANLTVQYARINRDLDSASGGISIPI